ncbi:MAG: DUF4363 family protein [Ruminococcaceae bacterium]|nr:DUF4363 family protein [Oscillospiraceae bacterium]
MKATLTSLLILTMLIGSGIYFHHVTENTCGFLHDNLKAATDHVAASNWDEANKTFLLMQKTWEKRKKYLALFTHHNLLDNVQIALARVAAASESRDASALSVECASLKKELDDLHHADRLEAENIF